jgi:hypothetical protein
MVRLLPSPLDFALISEDEDLFEPIPLEMLPPVPQRNLRPFSLDTAFQTEKPGPLQALWNPEEPRVLWRLTATSASSDTWLTSEGAFASGTPESLTGSRPMTDWYHRLRLVHARPWEKIRYGIEYQYEGNEQDGGYLQLWSEWKVDAVKLKTSIIMMEDNISKANYLPRLFTLESKIAVDVNLLADTRFGLSYSRASTRSTWEPLWTDPSKYTQDKVGASFVYQRSVWKAKLASTYASTQDQMTHQQAAMTLNHKLTLAYHLASALTITPSIHYKQKWTHSSAAWTTTPSVGLSVTHNDLFKDVDVTAKSSYVWSQKPHQAVDTRKFKTTGSLVWHLKPIRLGAATVSYELSYENVRDEAHPINA